MPLLDFFKKYFIDPMIYDQPYNIYNTTLYAIILIFAVFGIYKLFNKMKIKIDKNLIMSLIPFIVFGSSFRVWEDSAIITNPFFITPGSYLITSSIVLISIFIGILLEKKHGIKYYKTVSTIGIIFATISILGLRIINWFAFWAILVIFSLILISTEIFSRKFKVNSLYKFAFLSHMLDATATFVSLHFFSEFYIEQHVVSNFFITTFGPWSFFLVKSGVIIPVLYIISKSEDIETNWKNLIIFTILTLGLAPGLRNMFRLLMGV